MKSQCSEVRWEGRERDRRGFIVCEGCSIYSHHWGSEWCHHGGITYHPLMAEKHHTHRQPYSSINQKRWEWEDVGWNPTCIKVATLSYPMQEADTQRHTSAQLCFGYYMSYQEDFPHEDEEVRGRSSPHGLERCKHHTVMNRFRAYRGEYGLLLLFNTQHEIQVSYSFPVAFHIILLTLTFSNLSSDASWMHRNVI